MLFFKKRKKIKAIEEIILLWHSVCMQYIESEKLSEPRPLVGTCCFFIGSIDSICQSTKLNDKEFADISISLMKKMNFPKNVVLSILTNFYGKNEREVFAFNAMKVGMDSLSKWYNSSFTSEDSAKVLAMQISEWYKNPNMSVSEIALFGIKS
jgi:hypothetical protein